MREINILYDIQRNELKEIVLLKTKEVSKKNKIKINLDICDGWDLLNKLKANPNYDIVLLHLGGNNEGAYRQANKCRYFTTAILAGESSMYPANQIETLEHFDSYIGTIMNYDNLERLLIKHSFISS